MRRTSDRIRVLLVDDHVLVRTGLRMLIDNDPGFVVVGEAGTREEALAVAKEVPTDVILLDIDLGRDRATDFLKELQSIAQHARVLILTGLRDSVLHRET